jgi:hypothetical protein
MLLKRQKGGGGERERERERRENIFPTEENHPWFTRLNFSFVIFQEKLQNEPNLKMKMQ